MPPKPTARAVVDAKSAAKAAGLRVVQPLPMTTKIVNMGLPPTVIAKLSSAARQVTKADLVAMAAGRTPRVAASLTVNDLNLIKTGFARQLSRGGNLKMDIYCCCCPCCCATAVMEPKSRVA